MPKTQSNLLFTFGNLIEAKESPNVIILLIYSYIIEVNHVLLLNIRCNKCSVLPKIREQWRTDQYFSFFHPRTFTLYDKARRARLCGLYNTLYYTSYVHYSFHRHDQQEWVTHALLRVAANTNIHSPFAWNRNKGEFFSHHYFRILKS